MTGALAAGLDRDALLAEVKRVCDQHVPHGQTVLVAVSGGPDSTALAYLACEARPDLHLLAAHVRHGLRDDHADARLASEHAASLDIGYLERAVSVRAEGIGEEAAAREARYRALRQLARQASASAILVGHSADDQAETVLMNLVRGSGLRGLSGMSAIRDMDGVSIVRPLLRVRRSDIRAYIAGEGLQAVDDPTNRDANQRRARVRTRAMPALASLAGGPGDPVGSLTRMADLARADADALDDIAALHADRIARRWGPARCVRFSELDALPSALATRVVRELVRQVRNGLEGLSSDAVMSLRTLQPGAAIFVAGGAFATSGGGWLAVRPAATDALQPRNVTVPGETALPELELLLRADMPWARAPAGVAGVRQLQLDIGDIPRLAGARQDAPTPLAALPPGARGTAAGAWVVLPLDLMDGLKVRARRPGDRLSLTHGTRKLQDLFTDQGVPRAIRDLVPIVVDADDEPLWVPGVGQRALDDRREAALRLWLAPSSRRSAGRYAD